MLTLSNIVFLTWIKMSFGSKKCWFLCGVPFFFSLSLLVPSHHFWATAEENIIKPDFISFSCCELWLYLWGYFPIIKSQSCITITPWKAEKLFDNLLYLSRQPQNIDSKTLVGTTESSNANLRVIWPVLLILLLLHTIKPSVCTVRTFYLFSNTVINVQE